MGVKTKYKIGDLDLGIIVAFNNYTDRKIKHYEVCVMKCNSLNTYVLPNNDTISTPEFNTILRVKITKKQAKYLMDNNGYKVTAGYSVTGK